MQGLQYTVDIALCIDATGSMSGIIDRAKASALSFYEDLTTAMDEKDKKIDKLRIRVISFRDYYVDGDQSMVLSTFFELPEQKAEFSAFVGGIYAGGGGDEPENGLEALALAMKSDWTKTGDKRRQVVVVWTDASVHPLEKDVGSKPSHYPAGLPKTFDELTDLWEDNQGVLERSAKRLIIYGPDSYAWTDIGNHWNNSIHYPSKAGEGLNDIDYKTILDAIAHSV